MPSNLYLVSVYGVVQDKIAYNGKLLTVIPNNGAHPLWPIYPNVIYKR